MISLLPTILQIILLAMLGAILGSFINYAIYAWPYFLRRSISPWQKAHPEAPPRQLADRIPIFGWFGLRREARIYGNYFWVRPLLIEAVWAFGLPWFFFWQQGGGLLGQPLTPEPTDWALIAEVWFWLHGVLLALMCIATFIDFDERTIPDRVTIPGTLFALTVAAFFPLARLPETTSTMVGVGFEPLLYANGSELPLLGIAPEILRRGVDWHQQATGFWLVLAVFWGWILALLPKLCTMRFGLLRGCRLMIASCIRPRRKTVCAIRTHQRYPMPQTYLLGILGVTGSLALVAARAFLPEANWESLFCAFVGLGIGGLIIWSVRIVGGQALGKEAMGFGDVTLMAMIGAFLGWQAALLTLPAGAILALVVAVFMLVVTGETRLAFGPYLCLGATLILFNWGTVWPSLDHYFSLGEWLFVILMVMLGMMWMMLMGLSWLRGSEPEA